MSENMAECRFCGQPNMNASTDEEATCDCTCAEAKSYASNKEMEKMAAERRAEALNNAELQIKHLFTGGGEGYGWHSVADETIDIANRLAALVYDGEIKAANIQITFCNKMQIKKTGKGKLLIQRADNIINQKEV